MRNLPKTHQYTVEQLGGIVLNDYNIVGGGTPAALLPILAGDLEEDLPEARRGFTGAKPLDNHPWLWRKYQDHGYITLWTEEGPNFGTFQYRMLGFNNQPVDHYGRPYQMEVDHYNNNGFYRCYSDIQRHVNLLNWLNEATEVYGDRHKFAFLFFAELSHDRLDWLQIADDDFVELLKRWNDAGKLDNTMLILFADHGSRFSNVRTTLRGRIEERNPYVSIVMPRWFSEKFPVAHANLVHNGHRLTTPYDIHETLKDVLDWKEDYGRSDNFRKRGISLFRKISKDRTCQQAAIPNHFCACLKWEPIDLAKDPIPQAAAKRVVDAINKELIKRVPSNECASLQLSRVLTATKRSLPKEIFELNKVFEDTDDSNIQHEQLYQVTFEVLPSRGQFEATITYYPKSHKVDTSLNRISRVNKYGDQPKCIMDKLPYMRPYCFCKSSSGNRSSISP